MVSKEKESEISREIRKEIDSKISRDKKETTIRIPAELVSQFNIDANKDYFKWIVIGEQDTISLIGKLIKSGENI